MRKPKNYGEQQFKNLRRREHEPPQERPPKPAVFDHLQLQPTVAGPLDATMLLFELAATRCRTPAPAVFNIDGRSETAECVFLGGFLLASSEELPEDGRS